MNISSMFNSSTIGIKLAFYNLHVEMQFRYSLPGRLPLYGVFFSNYMNIYLPNNHGEIKPNNVDEWIYWLYRLEVSEFFCHFRNKIMILCWNSIADIRPSFNEIIELLDMCLHVSSILLSAWQTKRRLLSNSFKLSYRNVNIYILSPTITFTKSSTIFN